MSQENLSEKVSVNVSASVLSSIDLLVDHGYYANRSDFINHALRISLQQQQPTLERLIDRHVSDADPARHWFVGVYHFGADDLEALSLAGKKASISGYGVLVIESGLDTKKLYEAVPQIQIKGRVICPPEIRAHYGLPGKGR